MIGSGIAAIAGRRSRCPDPDQTVLVLPGSRWAAGVAGNCCAHECLSVTIAIGTGHLPARPSAATSIYSVSTAGTRPRHFWREPRRAVANHHAGDREGRRCLGIAVVQDMRVDFLTAALPLVLALTG